MFEVALSSPPLSPALHVGTIQTWCLGTVPRHRHQSEHNLLLASEHKFGHRAQAKVQAPEVDLFQAVGKNVNVLLL